MNTTLPQNRPILRARAVLSLLLCAAVTPAFAQRIPDEVETITGGTFLNLRDATTSETRGGYTLSALTLGANVTDPRNGSSVNWSLNDTSDNAFFIGGQCVEDNNRRSGFISGTTTPVEPIVGTSYNPFSFTVSGLTPGGIYALEVVALGRRSDPDSDPSSLLDGLRPDVGINSYDFSYGASAGSMTTFADTAAGTLLWETRAGSPINVEGVDYYYYTGSYACDIGDWTADGSGQFTLFLGEGAVNTVLNGSRTMLDGMVITPVPEPSTVALLGLGALALILRRRK